jgi:hypothetical protein
LLLQITKIFYMAGKTIPAATADEMIKAYFDYMTKLGVDMNKQTQSVSFTGDTVMNWLNVIMPKADELKIFMGTYPAGNPQAGRTTVILWPYKDGKPVTGSGAGLRGGPDPEDPFDDGTLGP